MDTRVHEDLRRNVESVYDSLVAHIEDGTLYDYLADALDIDVTASINKEYRGCLITVVWGGPGVYINTNRPTQIEGYWGGESYYKHLDDDMVREIDAVIEEWWNAY